MKKKYIKDRFRLVIGLLSLTSLCSCAHTNSILGVDANAQELQASSLENSTNEESVVDNLSIHVHEQEQAASNPQSARRLHWIMSGLFLTAQRIARTAIGLGTAVVTEIQENPLRALFRAELMLVGHYFIGVPMSNYLNESLGYTNACPRDLLPPHPEL